MPSITSSKCSRKTGAGVSGPSARKGASASATGCCADYPSMLAQGEDGNIYGATTGGGTGMGGFEDTNAKKINPSANFKQQAPEVMQKLMNY